MAASPSKLFSSLLLILLAFNAAVGLAHGAHSELDALHPLPPALTMERRSSKYSPRESPTERLRRGGWLLRFEPTSGVALDGTLRVEKNSSALLISGDLYRTSGETIDPTAGIPIFPRDSYANYIRGTSVKEGAAANSIDLELELYHFTPTSQTGGRARWTNVAEGGFNVTLTPGQTADSFTGELRRKDTGAIEGTLSAQWISKFFRKLTVELDASPDCGQPTDDGKGNDWHTSFAGVDWEVVVDVSDTDVPEPRSDGWWGDEELHQAMLAHRNPSTNFDKEWRVHVLSVRHINSTERGVMYDTNNRFGNTDARRGVAIAAHWIVGTLNSGAPDGTDWGAEQGRRFDQSPAGFFRTAVHEVGHALSLNHEIHRNYPDIDAGFMSTSQDIAEKGVKIPPRYPDNIKWDFSDIHKLYLRHLSDAHIRPGYGWFGTWNTTVELPSIAVDIAKREAPAALPFGSPC